MICERFHQVKKELPLTNMTFPALGLADPLLRSLEHRGHDTPTPIQAQAIPELLNRKDLLGIAQTGTGKTGAFALPILHHMHEWQKDDEPRGQRGPQALILAPTRELAIQIGAEMRAYGHNLNLKLTVIYGGVSQKGQITALNRGVDIVIATPGRLLDLYQQRKLRLDRVAFYVLDEADRMLDMGFIHDIKKITAALPKARQSLLFSATMQPPAVKIARDILHDPVRVEVTPQATPIDRIDQKVFRINNDAKTPLLVNILEDPSLARVIVFTRTKHRANKVAMNLNNVGILTDAFHGNKSQNARQQALARFTSGTSRVLVATDIAARGIDINAVSHVINYDLPNEPESYVHRIGRTARAGAGGIAWSFCDRSERAYLSDIERVIRSKIPLVENIPNLPKLPPLSMQARQSIDEDDDVRRARDRKPGGQRRSSGKPANHRARDGGGQGRSENHRNGRPTEGDARHDTSHNGATDNASEQRAPENRGRPPKNAGRPVHRADAARSGGERRDSRKPRTDRPDSKRRPERQADNRSERGKADHQTARKAGDGNRDHRPGQDRDQRSGLSKGGEAQGRPAKGPQARNTKPRQDKLGQNKPSPNKPGQNKPRQAKRPNDSQAAVSSGDRPVKRKTTQKPYRASGPSKPSNGPKKNRSRSGGNDAGARRVA
jgi:ATP-dependent RNA helicase RhlE